MGYRLLGWAFWHFSLRRRLLAMLPSRDQVVAAVVVAAVLGIAYAQSRMSGAD